MTDKSDLVDSMVPFTQQKSACDIFESRCYAFDAQGKSVEVRGIPALRAQTIAPVCFVDRAAR
jgi:hypothetical protein